MTGKPVYKPDEIRFALSLMEKDFYNDAISNAFRERFNRTLTDNQIRYLRNKYGKDPDYGAPLCNKQSKKRKERRSDSGAGSSASPGSEYVANTASISLSEYLSNLRNRGSPTEVKRARQGALKASAGPSQQPPYQFGSLPTQSPVKFEDMKSPSPSSAPLFYAAPMAQMGNLHSPPTNPYSLSSGALAQAGLAPMPAANSWQMQARANFNTDFSPINTHFGQHQIKSPDQRSPESCSTAYQTPLQSPNVQRSYASYLRQQPIAGSHPPVSSPQQAVVLSDFVYPQQVSQIEEHKQEQEYETSRRDDVAPMYCEEYFEPAQQAPGQSEPQATQDQDEETSEQKISQDRRQSAASGTSGDINEHKTAKAGSSHDPKN
ncbi:hypothetical protein FPANT_8072 [Fusarium pseudoanthophilum]|uniref:Uncharacterized protein n=1 Tax=Fusarium pseudoanthophilum TaxID=48495 RepID=A0A8H5L4Q2_9HYPO|nr:hypothetical protein FPANT_8072 [Fusarium pseudoanthophilum]